MNERHLPHEGVEEDLKPDIREDDEEQPLRPDEAMRRELDTYAETDLDPNRQDMEDEHQAGPDEHV